MIEEVSRTGLTRIRFLLTSRCFLRAWRLALFLPKFGSRGLANICDELHEQCLSVVDLSSLAWPIGLTRSFRSRDYKIVGSWILGPFLGARLGNLFVDFWGSFSTSDLGRVGGASEDA